MVQIHSPRLIATCSIANQVSSTPLIGGTSTRRIIPIHTGEHRDSHSDDTKAEEDADRPNSTDFPGRNLRDVRERDAGKHSVVGPRQAVARGDSGLIENHVRAVPPGQAHESRMLGGDELLRGDSLHNVPTRTRREIAE